MSALTLIFSTLHLRATDSAVPADEKRRFGHDRRTTERRSRVLPFESREARLRFAAQAAGFGTFDFDCLAGEGRWSPELKALAGLPPGDGPMAMDQLEALIHPEDRERFVQRLRAALDPQGNGSLDDEYRLQRPDGVVRWTRFKGRTFFTGTEGERHPLALTGIVMDVTASRAAEQELVDGRDELAGLVEAACDAIVSIDREQRIVRFNPAASRMFRCPVDEALGSPVARFVPERHRDAQREGMCRFARGAITARSMEMPGIFTGVRADGEEFPLEGSIAKVKVGGQWLMTAFLRDVTARRAAEEALRRSKADLELAVRGANIGIWHWDLRSGRIDWSPRCYELFGIPAQTPMTYQRLMAAIHPDDRERVEASVARNLSEGGEYHIQCRIVRPDGSQRWVEAIGRDLCDGTSGQAVGIRGVALDITERKRQEEALLDFTEQLENRIEDRTAQLLQANEALERSNLELQQFAFIAAHDLQTPLRSITGFAQLLQKDYQGRLDAQADIWLGQLIRSSHRMRDVIQDILAYSRVESRGNTFQATDCNQLFDDVVATLDAPIRETGARVSRDELPTVLGDRSQLAQVLQNLIDNGIKYHAGEAGEPPRVHVSARREGGEWHFSVRDNGIGIADKHLEQIFDIFRRLHTQQEYPGTGIGLAICRRVIHRHGGRIWVESEPGRGSLFHFTLPAGPGPAP